MEKYRQPSFNTSHLPPAVDRSLELHAFHPKMTLFEAERALKGHPPFTYLIRPSETGRGFGFSFVQKNGHVKHDHFRLLIPQYHVFMNGVLDHVGSLNKVVRDMMGCSELQGHPLALK